MNERIKQLAKKAGITFKPMIVDSVEYEYRHVHLNDYTNGIDEATCIEQFAELIIEECVTMLDHNGNYLIDDAATKQIKQHFGVEE